ncbi:hypothetical protein JOM56_013505 [Amanita muscaria]
MSSFDDINDINDTGEGGEPPRKIITDYAALEAALEQALEKSSCDGSFPICQVEKHQTTFCSTVYPISSGCSDNTCLAPEPEPKNFHPLPPPPRPSMHHGAPTLNNKEYVQEPNKKIML